ncbi:hypothetical protein [Burkholderia gladioli]|uniref:hypothetical protein n=1 Tax=Burkholderia gladioli TaxID=28095 RepID=UPI0016421A0E|nr:hypothetical protein [Burkholderia gladioli]
MNASDHHRLSADAAHLLLALVSGSLFAGMAPAAHAGPSDCKPGRQDNTCVAFIHHAAIPAPVCPDWQRQVSPPVWLGTYWSQPVCVTPDPPPPPPPPPPPTQRDLVAECIGRSNAKGYAVTQGTTNRSQLPQGSYISVQLWPVFGQWYQDVSVYTNEYEYFCNFNPTTLELQNEGILDYWFFHPNGGGGGGN